MISGHLVQCKIYTSQGKLEFYHGFYNVWEKKCTQCLFLYRASKILLGLGLYL